MKTIKYIFFIFGILVIMLSCEKEKDNLLELPYIFRPIGFSVNTVKTKATFTWFEVDSAVSYTIQISQDSLEYTNIIKTDTITSTTYVIELGGSTRYSARVKANARISSKDSKYNESLTFKTPAENIMEDYKSIMFEQGSAKINWLPYANATKLVFKSEGNPDIEFNIDENDKSSGSKICSGLNNGLYTVEIYNDIFKRGQVKVLLEGDIWLSNGDNLATSLAGITQDSTIIVLRPGVYNIGGTYTVNYSLKIRGLYPDTLSTICPDGSSSKYFELGSTSKINYMQFENLDLTGYANNNTAGTKIAYMINQSNACNVGDLVFENCKIHNFGNTPFRLQTTAAKVIDNISLNNCTLNEFGYSSVYAVINLNAVGTACYVSNISFTNSTVYNFAGSLILHNSSNSVSVNIQNCTFNEICTSGTSGTSLRRFIDYTANYNVTNGILIKNCIFGSTPRPYAEGVRANASTVTTISGSYYTSDFDDNNDAVATSSITGFLTPYSGASTDLFTAPLTGDFTIKDASFTGKSTVGDPRWRQ